MKQSSPREITVFGSVTVVRVVQSTNAFAPISLSFEVVFEGKYISVSDSQFRKLESLIFVTFFGIVIDERFVQFLIEFS